MKALLVLWYPGYLRYADALIQELADRGHEVVVSFTNETKQREGLEALDAIGGRVAKGPRVPKRRGRSSSVASTLRKVADYSRYLHPRYVEAEHLRRRHEKFLPPGFSCLTRLPALHPRLLGAVHAFVRWLERAVPSDPRLERFIAEIDPDVVVVSPLVTAARQSDVVKSANALGLPTVLSVASWDHLSTKGLVKVRPDRTLVWNEIQRTEARAYHHLPRSEVVVTGAPPFDRWFGRRPTLVREAFCRKVGLPAERPFVLFLGSTDSISETLAEQRFVRAWAAALRAWPDSALAEASILVRPHPYNPGSWDEADLSGLGEIAVWPRGGANPVNEEDRADYFDSLFHSVATVGINTSAMIEAAIVGRPVLTVRSPDFSDTQDGTVHFHYLRTGHGGFVREATSLEEHAAQLAAVVSDPDAVGDELAEFVGSFVRPLGRERPSTPIAADAIEAAAALEPSLGSSRLSVALGRTVLRAIESALSAAKKLPAGGGGHRQRGRDGSRSGDRGPARRARRSAATRFAAAGRRAQSR